MGIAFTIQVVAQKKAHPANAAIIMSLEAVFALIGGWIVLNETISIRGLFGCLLMFTGNGLKDPDTLKQNNISLEPKTPQAWQEELLNE